MRIALLSDIHLIPRGGPERFFRYGAIEPDVRVQFAETLAVLREIFPVPELILLNGDLTNEGDLESYRYIQEQLRQICPCLHALPGNHDNQKNLRAVFPAMAENPNQNYYSFEFRGAVFILLDSVIATPQSNEIHGAIGRRQLLWLRRELERNRERTVHIFLHHPPLNIGVAWMDELNLRNREEFLECLAGHSQIRMVFYSHLHHFRESALGGIRLVCIPSASFWFPEVKEDGIPLRPPEFLLADIDGADIRLERIRTSTKGLRSVSAHGAQINQD